MTTLNSGRRAGFLLRLLALLVLVSTALAQPQAVHATSTVCYVDGAAGGLNNGTSWTDAYTKLQSALSTCSGEVWVKAGLYTPADFKSGPNQTDTYNFPAGLAVYGGFAGTETTRAQRDPAVNVTILSGDLFNDDTNLDGNHIDETAADIQGSNSYQVVTMDAATADVTSTTVLDGFTLTGGQGGPFWGGGGGLLCVSRSGHPCSPTLANLTFSGNEAPSCGGGLLELAASSPTLTNVTFTGNTALNGGAICSNPGARTSISNLTNVTFSGNSATQDGGAMYNIGSTGGISSPTLTNVAFRDNHAAGDGGAMYDYGLSLGFSSPTLTNVTFSGNIAALSGGGISNHADDGTTSPGLTNVTFSNNQGQASGGGMASIVGNGGISSSTLTNVTFYGNSTSGPGGALYYHGSISDDTGTSTLSNVILWGNVALSAPEIFELFFSPSIDHSVVQGSGGSGGSWDTALGIDGGGNLDTDPLLEALANNGGFTQTMALMSGSPAIDAGTDTGCPTTDQRGVTRPQGPYCDIGAYESLGDVVEVYAGESLKGTHLIPHAWAQEHNYAGVNSGPAEAFNIDGGSVVASIRVLFGGSSYSEMMGYPNNTTTDFWFPWYNNTAFDSQFRVSNLGAQSTTITVSLGGSTIDSFTLPAATAIRKNYPGQNSGPMHVSSSGSEPILATIRVLFGGSSYSEMMGFPNTTTDFWFPWYNNVAMNSQFRVSNLGGTPTTITVSLAGSPIDSFTLPAGAAVRKNYAGQNNGPMHVSSSTTPILATIRVLYGGSSYSEMMGFRDNSTTDFWFPWYNDIAFDSQFRVSNLGGSPTTITVSLAGVPIDSFTLGAGAAIRKSYASQNNGAFHITSSGEPILATVRVLYAGTSFYEVMGYPGNELTDTQYFPWYNNTAFNSQMRIAVP